MRDTTKLELELEKTRKIIKLRKAMIKINKLETKLNNYYNELLENKKANEIKLNKLNKLLSKCNYKWLDINEKLSNLIKL